VTDKAITAFFEERKAAWLKKKVKKSMSEQEVAALEAECEEIFAPQNWLPDAARRAGQMAMASHPCTFSHPSSRKNRDGNVTPVICDAPYENDGLLRCGNIKDTQSDALGNAAVLDVYKFLDLRLEDGKRVIEHIRDNTPTCQAIVQSAQNDDEAVRRGFLKMIEADNNQTVTSSKIKQVYFPIDQNAYHLLSILTYSGALFRLKEAIDKLRFSEEVKEAREARRQNKKGSAYRDLFELTVLGYGGTKPQNVSVLNNRYGGKTYLLRSMPPTINKQEIRFPKRDFFEESLPYRKIRDIFKALKAISETDYNNLAIREGRKRRYRQLMEIVIETMWLVRSVAKEQYYEPTSSLPEWQRVWLVNETEDERQTRQKWLEELSSYIARWIVRHIEHASKKELKLGKAELNDIAKIIDEYQEELR